MSLLQMSTLKMVFLAPQKLPSTMRSLQVYQRAANILLFLPRMARINGVFIGRQKDTFRLQLIGGQRAGL